jgi:RNA polymerase sigma-70 factor, ECF subfamily
MGGHELVHDDDVTARLAADLDGAFEQLALAYQRRLYAFALRMTGRREDAEEIAQDALVRAYRALASYPRERILALRLRPWLFQIAANAARNHTRRPRLDTVPMTMGSDDQPAYDPPDDEGIGPEAMAERAERRRELAAALLSLPERYRAAVILRHVEGLGYEEIAVALGHPVGTVKAHVHRGVLVLREVLAREMSEVR